MRIIRLHNTCYIQRDINCGLVRAQNSSQNQQAENKADTVHAQWLEGAVHALGWRLLVVTLANDAVATRMSLLPSIAVKY